MGDDFILSLGIDLDDPSTWKFDAEGLSDEQLDVISGTHRSLSHLLGKRMADTALSHMTRQGTRPKRRKLEGEFHSRISPIITGTHYRSFYDDPRDRMPSELRDQDDSGQAEHCCDRCQHMTGTLEGLSSLVSPEGYQHFTCDQVRKAADINGCPSCELIRRILAKCAICSKAAEGNGLIKFWGISEDDARNTEHPFRRSPRLAALKAKIPLNPLRAPERDSHHDHELEVLAFQESPAAQYVVGRRPGKSLSPELVQRLREWLSDCQDSRDGHRNCPRRVSPELPTRVVDLGTDEGSPIRLRVNPSGARGHYTQRISVSVFPKTLSDAIKVCRAMHIRYIWIDALCIVQNDAQDKAREIGRMGRVYKDATVTIMAASAPSVHTGFLDDAKADAPEVKLPFHLDPSSFGSVFIREPFDGRSYFLDEEPIFKRAWTLQEMLLPSRIVMFDSYQMTFKCGCDEFTPALPTSLQPEARLSSYISSDRNTLTEFHLETLLKSYSERSSVLKAQDAQGFDLTNSGHFSSQCRMWGAVMAEYSKRDLAVLDDRFPALAGITEELQRAWGGEFIAGFWKDSLVQHLGWVGGVVAGEQYAGKTWEERLSGPSWSWMSHPSSISIDPVAITDVEVIGYEVELAFPDQPYGPAKSGSLVLEARTLPLSLLQTRTKIRPNVDAMWKRVCAVMPAAIDGVALDFPSKGLPESDNLKAMVLGMTFGTDSSHCVTFLVLRRLESDTYERIGQAVLHVSFDNEAAAAIMSQAKREIVVLE